MGKQWQLAMRGSDVLPRIDNVLLRTEIVEMLRTHASNINPPSRCQIVASRPRRLDRRPKWRGTIRYMLSGEGLEEGDRMHLMKTSLFAYGFRSNFFLAGLAAMVLVPLWVVSFVAGTSLGSGWPPTLWHGHEMLLGFIASAIAGFMLTAVRAGPARRDSRASL
jgi:hypothetical protein